MKTLADLIDRHGVDVLEHLDRDASVPVHSGVQLQGDVAVIPAALLRGRPDISRAKPVPAAGVPVVRGENGGNTHLLIADGPGITWSPAPERRDPTALDLGVLTIPAGSTAYLAHPEHAYTGIAPGQYVIHRQREQAEQVRLVAD